MYAFWNVPSRTHRSNALATLGSPHHRFPNDPTAVKYGRKVAQSPRLAGPPPPASPATPRLAPPRPASPRLAPPRPASPRWGP
ncbi:Protein of unknown function [Gryllus bimaculatus]|nr:Protein of unknown function [Gryllus bimaculatus]